jgi:hypothetical protein
VGQLHVAAQGQFLTAGDNYVVGVEMRHYPFADDTAAQAWLRLT